MHVISRSPASHAEMLTLFCINCLTVHMYDRPTSTGHHQCLVQAEDHVSTLGVRMLGDVKAYSVPADLLPLNPLSRDRELSPQPLKASLRQLHESPVQLFLEFILCLCNLPDDSIRATSVRDVNVLARAHPDVAILVVVHINLDRTFQSTRRRREGVGGTPAAIPKVLRRVFVCDEQDGDVTV